MLIRNWSEVDVDQLCWRTEDNDAQADSFIEWCFEKKCAELYQGAKILNEWRQRKERYSSYTRTTIFDFQHYSRHDESHSINILNAVEMVLGRNRVKLLSAADLWTLLESAYFHDIGMAFSHRELSEMWSEDEDFKLYIKKVRHGEDADLKEAAAYYGQINNLLHQKNQMKGTDGESAYAFSDSWPVELQRYVVLLTTEYIRKNHAAKSRDKMEKMLSCENVCSIIRIIPDRLYRIVSEIAYLHGEEYERIGKELSYQDLGFDTETVHPQFIAAMLRLGDLLDMDNNRFDLRAIEHFGRLPYTSNLHYKKHKALVHFDITPTLIEARAESDDQEVCRTASAWFQWIDKEVENLICDWNCFAPPELKGCQLQRCKLEVLFGKSRYDAQLSKSYQIDKKRLLKLMEGFNLYDSPLDCLREYLQNALDASKMQMWLELKRDPEKLCGHAVDRIEKICPFDIAREEYEDKAVEIGILLDLDRQTLGIRIQDRGIGMEEECVDALSIVGRSWKQRTVFRNEVDRMPDWLKPTGGFGIGLQSAFMLTDEIIIHTKSERDNKCYEVHLYSPSENGNMTKQSGAPGLNGTIVEFEVGLLKSYELMAAMQELDFSTFNAVRDENGKVLHEEIAFSFKSLQIGDSFSETVSEEYIGRFLDYYVRKALPDTLFPIRICIDKREDMNKTVRRKFSVYRSPFASAEGGFGFLDDRMTMEDEHTNTSRYLYHVAPDMTVRIWDMQKNVLACFMCWPEPLTGRRPEQTRLMNPMCYKNTRVGYAAVQRGDMDFSDFLAVCVDVMGGRMENILSVQRDSFTSEFNIHQVYDHYMKLYLKIIIDTLTVERPEDYKKTINARKSLSILDFILTATRMLPGVETEKLISRWAVSLYEPRKVMMEWIENRKIVTGSVGIEDVLRWLVSLCSEDAQDNKPETYTFVAVSSQNPNRVVDVFSLQKEGFPLQDQPLQELNECICADGTLFYVYEPVCEMLLKMSEQYPKRYIQIIEDPDQRVYAAIKNLGRNMGNSPSEALSEADFAVRAFHHAEDERYIGINVSCQPYDGLKVSCLPDGKQEASVTGRGNEYIISPVGRDMFDSIIKRIGADRQTADGMSSDRTRGKYRMNNKFQREEFVNLVTSSPEFSFIEEWTLKYQCADSGNRLDKGSIHDLYIRMLETMYQENFEVL